MVKSLTEINILWFLVPLYAIAVGMMKFTSPLFVGLAFDSGGVTGGHLEHDPVDEQRENRAHGRKSDDAEGVVGRLLHQAARNADAQAPG